MERLVCEMDSGRKAAAGVRPNLVSQGLCEGPNSFFLSPLHFTGLNPEEDEGHCSQVVTAQLMPIPPLASWALSSRNSSGNK